MPTPRVALVTGASRGIGLAIAQTLAAQGWRLVLTARDRPRLEAAAADLAAAEALAFDLRDPTSPDQLIAAAERRAGPIELLVNNAGTAPSDKFERTTDAALDEVLDLHVKAPFRLLRAVLPGMRARRRGTLIQVASTAGLRGYPLIAAYTAAKHALVGLTRALATELQGSGVCAYAVCPGFVDTDITRSAAAAVASRGKHSADQVLAAYAGMNACGRLLRTDEVAAVVLELASGQRPNGTIVQLDEVPPTYST